MNVDDVKYKFNLLVKDIWDDSKGELAQRLKNDPVATLKQYGIEYHKNLNINFAFDEVGKKTIVIPRKPKTLDWDTFSYADLYILSSAGSADTDCTCGTGILCSNTCEA